MHRYPSPPSLWRAFTLWPLVIVLLLLLATCSVTASSDSNLQRRAVGAAANSSPKTPPAKKEDAAAAKKDAAAGASGSESDSAFTPDAGDGKPASSQGGNGKSALNSIFSVPRCDQGATQSKVPRKMFMLATAKPRKAGDIYITYARLRSMCSGLLAERRFKAIGKLIRPKNEPVVPKSDAVTMLFPVHYQGEDPASCPSAGSSPASPNGKLGAGKLAPGAAKDTPAKPPSKPSRLRLGKRNVAAGVDKSAPGKPGKTPANAAGASTSQVTSKGGGAVNLQINVKKIKDRAKGTDYLAEMHSWCMVVVRRVINKCPNGGTVVVDGRFQFRVSLAPRKCGPSSKGGKPGGPGASSEEDNEAAPSVEEKLNLGAQQKKPATGRAGSPPAKPDKEKKSAR